MALLGHTPKMHFVLLDGQTITACASGQPALDLRTLPRGATISATLYAAPDELEIIAFTITPS